MKLIIDRATWLRGEPDVSCLRDRSGRMCCLGFYGLACGVPYWAILEQVEPQYAQSAAWPISCVEFEDGDGLKTRWTDEAIRINDSRLIGDVARERLLVEHFAKVGVDVEFR